MNIDWVLRGLKQFKYVRKRKRIFMEIKEHLYFKSQKITISGVLNYIIRSNSLYTYITSNSFNKLNTGDPLKKKKTAGALEEKMTGALEEKMAGAPEEKAVDLKKKKKKKKKKKGKGDKGERHNEEKARRRRRWGQRREVKWLMPWKRKWRIHKEIKWRVRWKKKKKKGKTKKKKERE